MGGQDQITSNESAVCGEASWMADGGLGHDATETTRDPISRRGSTGGGCCGTEGTRTTEEGRGGEGGPRWFILWSGCRHANQKRQLCFGDMASGVDQESRRLHRMLFIECPISLCCTMFFSSEFKYRCHFNFRNRKHLPKPPHCKPRRPTFTIPK